MQRPVRLGSGLFVALLVLLALPGCATSPAGFAARFTEQGRLLMDGPRSRMTAAAIAENRANEVPLLYEFAIKANQIPTSGVPGAPVPFPARTIDEQQLALTGVRDWRAVTLVGEGYIDEQCGAFVDALNELERTKKTTLANLNAVQGATIGIMGLALAAQKTIGIVGVAFGLAASLFDTTTSTVLFELPAPSVESIVTAQRQYLRATEDVALANVTNQGMAAARLAEYVRYCAPVTIEANIAKVLGNTRGVPEGLVTEPTQPAVISAFVHTGGFRATLATRQDLKQQIDALDGGELLALALVMEPKLAAASPRLRSTVQALDARRARFTNPAVARQILEIWVVVEEDPTPLLTWATAIRSVRGG